MLLLMMIELEVDDEIEIEIQTRGKRCLPKDHIGVDTLDIG